MAELPIIFSAPMIQALLAGRKTQTRRLAKVWIYDHVNPRFSQLRARRERSGWRIYGSEPASDVFKVPYAVGDRLYVREAWAPLSALTHSDPGAQALAARGFYKADESTVDGEIARWRPSIHMPRWASRLTLLVTDVRVERLQDISEADAIAEGVTNFRWRDGPAEWRTPLSDSPLATARFAFSDLWKMINGAGSWAANPWVVAVTFSVHARNIDQLAPADALDIAGAA